MKLPQQYPYNPKGRTLWIGVLLFGGGSLFMAHMANHPNEGLSFFPTVLGQAGAALFYWVVAVLAAIAAVWVIVALFMGLDTNDQVLELCEDAIVLPQRHFFKIRITRIPYAEIEQVQEVQVSGQTFLYLTSGGRKLMIIASHLPDMESYIAIKDFLLLHTQRQEQRQGV